MSVTAGNDLEAARKAGFFDLLAEWREAPSVGTEDLLAAVLPLMRQVLKLHEAGKVAPLDDIGMLHVDHGHLWFRDAEARDPRRNPAVLKSAGNGGALDVVGALDVTRDDVEGLTVRDHALTETEGPGWDRGYGTWEHNAGHHDPLTDILSLGLVVGSLATRLDLREEKDRETFVHNRANLTALNDRIHPVVARAVERMTALKREDRAPDLAALITAMENHRRVGSDFEAALATTAGFGLEEAGNPRSATFRRLRARLYDMTRRNRLLYHRPVAGELNLTEASVPLVLNVDAVREDQIFTARAKPMDRLVAGKEVVLGEYIRFEEMAFAPSVLTRLRADANRDRREFGTSSLRLVPVFLRWRDLKQAPGEQISSPLLMLRVELTRRKAVKDAFTLKVLDTKADVNPALAFLLDTLYDIRLPATVDLAEKGALDNLHASLVEQIARSEPAVSLEKIEKPRLRLLHQRVRRRLDNFNRRRAAQGKSAKKRGDLTYSYARRGYDPLGVKLFREYVLLPDPPSRESFEAPAPRLYNMVDAQSPEADGGPKVRETTSTAYAYKRDGESPYHWAFDLCAVTLANFNYRKMSLVRDYDELIGGAMGDHGVFETFFGDAPRPIATVPALPPVDRRYLVVPADPTQEQAVFRSRRGESYVIQGPPGTGKSQTITNLIADFIGEGKRVLFVCEKRAALDVVFNRLRGAGLDRLTALIHDSQDNKREFIQELERIYEDWIAPGDGASARIEADRRAALDTIAKSVEQLSALEGAMGATPAGAEERLADVLRQSVACIDARPDLDAATRERLPGLADWRRWRDAVTTAERALRSRTGTGLLSASVERLIAPGLWDDDELVGKVSAAVARIEPQLAPLADLAPKLRGDAPSLATLFAQCTLARRLAPAVEAGRAGVFDPASPEAADLRAGLRAVADAGDALARKQERTAVWRDKLSPEETQAALSVARAKEGSFFAFLSGDWRRVKRLVRERTATEDMAVEPSVTGLLEALAAEHEAAAAVEDARRRTARDFGYDDLDTLTALTDERDRRAPVEGRTALPLLLAAAAGETDGITDLARAAPLAEALRESLSGTFEGTDTLPLAEAPQTFASLASAGDRLRALQPALRPLVPAPERLWDALRALPLETDALEAAILYETVAGALDALPGLSLIDGAALTEIRTRIGGANRKLLDLNAELLVERARARFEAHVQLSNTPERDTPRERREERAAILKARRMLEHEFKKKQRHRSPRELLAGEAGALLPDLKPIWLMSPLSVADVLPLAPDLFDVVIFDEASQIPVEDAIPTLYRAPQVIVVGDEKQLPPTSFFASAVADEDFDGQEENLDFELNGDSFLGQSAEKLPATMLGWHYRSRSEALIGFCNEAFYGGRLLTIPSVRRLRGWDPIEARDPAEGESRAADVLDRPVSFHYLPDAIYEDRRNRDEATYIAHLVRGLLRAGTGRTIGIVAFSEAQQGRIESALDRLAGEDSAFSDLLEAERDRTEEDEYVGLFVKNLENVQGDERDIVILSVCYGPDPKGRMRMNFGPINKAGGEKRLNVIFSRAREHMAVVSSIRAERITNDYNQGAATLKAYLSYAEALSRGDEDQTDRALNAVAHRGRAGAAGAEDAVREGLAAALRAEGVEVRENLGMSGFKLDLALRHADDPDFRLAVMLDDRAGPTLGGLRERLVERSNILEAFGWQVATVAIKDWWRDPEAVTAALMERMGG